MNDSEEMVLGGGWLAWWVEVLYYYGMNGCLFWI